MMSWQEEREQERLREAQKQRAFYKFVIGATLAGLLVLVGLITLLNSFTVVSPGNVGVKYSLSGGVQEDVLPEGWQWHSPFVNVEEMPINKRTVYLTANETEGSPNNDSFDVNTKDGKSVNVDATYAYYFLKEKTPHIYVRFQRADADTIARTYIKQQLKGAIQAVTTQYSVTEVYGGERRNELTIKVQELFAERLLKDGIVVEDFTFQDIRPDANTLQMIQKIVDAKNQEEFLKQEYRNKEQEAKNRELQAETDKKVAIIEAEKQKEVTILNAQAKAEEFKKLQEELTPLLIQKQWIEQWDGKLPVYQMGSGQNMMFQIPTGK